SPSKEAAGVLTWARRRKAQTLAQFKDYEHTMQAVKLIEQNAKDGRLSTEDTLSIITIMADRPEPQSRAKATQMLEKLRETQSLNGRQMSALGQLYNLQGKWPQAREMMLAAINVRSDDPEVLSLFAGMMLDHGEAEEAARFVDRLEELLAK